MSKQLPIPQLMAQVQSFQREVEEAGFGNPDSLDAYQRLAVRTLGQDGDNALATVALGLAGEAGEVADIIKKVIGHGHTLDEDAVAKEIGDVLWYVAVMAHLINFPLSTIAVGNIAKLRARYPDGFSTERSINRGNE